MHRIKAFNKLDFDNVHGIPCMFATRTLIEIVRTETPKRLTVALDSAIATGSPLRAFFTVE